MRVRLGRKGSCPRRRRTAHRKRTEGDSPNVPHPPGNNIPEGRPGGWSVAPYWERRRCLRSGPNPEIFELGSQFLRPLTAETDRRLLRHRIAQKLSGARRGRLRLPLHFPSEVRKLTELTTSQLRKTVYAFRADDSTGNTVDHCVVDFARRVVPDGRLRTVRGDNAVHVRQSNMVHPCKISDWPRLGTRPAWPSSPTIKESLVMARKGLVAPPLQIGVMPAKRRITLSEVKSNADLRARIIATNVVGIRSDVKVPDKYLGYFRYRWSMLLLTCSYHMPIGLVRFLTGQWIRCPHNLWLQDKTSFKNFLKKTDRTRFPCFQPGPW